MEFIRVPMLGVNDTSASLFWEVSNGSLVHTGQVIATLTTSKAAIELEAASGAHVYQTVESGVDVENNQIIALIHESPSLSTDEVLALIPKEQVAEVERTATAKAVALATKHGIDLADIQPSGDTIREADVLAYLEENKPADSSPVPGSSVVTRLLVIGSGGAGGQIVSLAARLPHLRLVGAVDDSPKASMPYGIPVLGKLADVPRLLQDGCFDAAVIAIGAPKLRKRIFEEMRAKGVPFTNVIDPSCVIDLNVRLGLGNVLCAFVHVGPNTVIGDNNFISAYCNIEHDNRMGSHSDFGPGVMTSGSVRIGSTIQFGTGVFIQPKVTIEEESVIGSGAIVLSNVPARHIVRSVPVQPRPLS